jgi:DNA-binding XRE family transcriptional regulator
MSTHGGRGEVGLAMAMLRMLRGWERADLVRALGVSRSWISELETGKKEPAVRTVQRVIGALGLPLSALEQALALVRGVRGMVAEGAAGVTASGSGGRQVRRGRAGLAQPDAGLAWDGTGLSGVVFELVGASLRADQDDPGGSDAGQGVAREGAGAEGRADKGAGNAEAADPEETRRRAAEHWARLRHYPREERLALVREAVEFQSWALCERLCEESAQVGAENPPAALELAELAVEVALVARVDGTRAPVPAGLAGTGGRREMAVPRAPATWPPDTERWRDRLCGYAWAFVGKARRLAWDPAGAEEAFGRSRELWPAGAPGEASQLDGLRLVELAASLRRGRD